MVKKKSVKKSAEEAVEEECINCCCWIVRSIFGSLVILFFVWIGVRVSDNPKCSIEDFYIPALNKTLNSQLNTTLNFMVLFDNPNEDNGIYYDDVNITISNINPIRDGTTNYTTIGNYIVPKFYQGLGKKAKKWGQVVPVNNQTVLQAVLPNGSAVFRLDLKTRVRFKVMFTRTKRHTIKVGADVEVNGNGTKAQEKGIKLKKSNSSLPLRSSFLICVLVNLLVFFAIL